MAHLIKLHSQRQNQEILFNLDTMVSAEKSKSATGELTSIQTKMGYRNVKETLEEILEKSKKSTLDNP